MKIFVVQRERLLTGASLELEVDSRHTIATVKATIQVCLFGFLFIFSQKRPFCYFGMQILEVVVVIRGWGKIYIHRT